MNLRAPLPLRLKRIALALTAALLALIAVWVFAAQPSATGAAVALLLTAPLSIGFWRLWLDDRRAYAWMTLAVAPYLALALMEVLANPAARIWAATCLLIAFALFVSLIAYLRATRRSGRRPGAPTDEPEGA